MYLGIHIPAPKEARERRQKKAGRSEEKETGEKRQERGGRRKEARERRQGRGGKREEAHLDVHLSKPSRKELVPKSCSIRNKPPYRSSLPVGQAFVLVKPSRRHLYQTHAPGGELAASLGPPSQGELHRVSFTG